MNIILKTILDFLFPIECLNCHAPGEFLCNECIDLIEIRNIQQCPLCNTEQTSVKLCNDCKTNSYLDEIIICANYNNKILQKTIHYFKYKYIRDLQAALGQIINKKLGKVELPTNIKLIPTPLHKRRLIERGFNQAELLAQQLPFPIINNVLWRQKNIQHQAELNKKQRLKNITNCFGIKNADIIKDQNILLVDDVITTGATLNEQAKLLKQNNARSVWALVIAKN